MTEPGLGFPPSEDSFAHGPRMGRWAHNSTLGRDDGDEGETPGPAEPARLSSPTGRKTVDGTEEPPSPSGPRSAQSWISAVPACSVSTRETRTGSASADCASSKPMPCFARLTLALRLSHRCLTTRRTVSSGAYPAITSELGLRRCRAAVRKGDPHAPARAVWWGVTDTSLVVGRRDGSSRLIRGLDIESQGSSSEPRLLRWPNCARHQRRRRQ
jgi:hypothetical protein